MEVHHPGVTSALAKKLWKVVRVSLYMIRKGLVSKRKLILMDINLMMKRGKLLLNFRKTVNNLLSHSHHHGHRGGRHGSSFFLREYEFSCSNSPNPVFSHIPKRINKHHSSSYFPCINLPHVQEEEEEVEEDVVGAAALVPRTPDYEYGCNLSNVDFSPEEKCSPLLFPSPFSAVRVSDCSAEEYNCDQSNSNNNGGNVQIDREAEEFITRFYEQLRVQSRMQLLSC